MASAMPTMERTSNVKVAGHDEDNLSTGCGEQAQL